jgi:hypothetical protein
LSSALPFGFGLALLDDAAPGGADSSVKPVIELFGVKDSGRRIEGTIPFLIPLKKFCT